MPTIDEVLQGPEGFYIADVIAPALRNALGRESEIQAWYRKQRQRKSDWTYREEDWFLTPRTLVKAVITADSVTVERYPRSAITKIERVFEVGFGRYGAPAVALKRLLAVVGHGTDAVSVEIPAPDEDQRDRFLAAYWHFTELLG